METAEKQKKVLLVEDDESHLRLMEIAFKSANGWIFESAQNLETARIRISSFKPDLIISDLKLPDGLGADLIDGKSPDGKYPIVLITSRGDEAKAVEIMKKGALDYARKTAEVFEQAPEIADRALRQWRLIEDKRKADFELTQHKIELEMQNHELKEIQRQLEISRDNYSDLYNFAPIGYITIDCDGRILESNQTFAAMLDRPRKDIIAESIERFIAKIDKDKIYFFLKTIKKGETPNLKSIRFQKSDGGEFCGKITYNRQKSARFREEILLLTVSDITPQMRAENELKRSEEKFRRIVENMNEAIYVLDAEGRATYMSPGIEEVYGYKPENVVGRDISEFISEEDRPRLLDNLKNVDKNERRVNEYRAIDGAGNERWIRVSSSPIFNEKGEYAGMQGVIADISERKKMEEALIKSEANYKKIFENIIDVLFRIEPGGLIRLVSPSIKKLLKRPNNETMARKNFFEEFCFDVEEMNRFRSAVENCDKLTNYDLTLKKADGTPVYCEINVEKMSDESGVYYEGIIRDASERKSSEKVRNVLYEISKAAASARDLDELYKKIHVELSKIIDTTNFFIAIYDKYTNIVRLPYFVDENDMFTEFKMRKTCTSYVITNAKPALIDQKLYSELVSNRELEAIGTPSKIWLGAPLISDDEAFGAVVVQSYENENQYDEKDLELLVFVSDQIAHAIKRKMAEENLKKLNEELEQLVFDRTSQLEDALEKLKYENFERKNAQDRLRAAKREVESSLEKERELNELKTRFISMVSHEYRTPLTVVLSSTYLLEQSFEKRNPEKFSNHIMKIRSAVNTMTQLLEDVLAIGRKDWKTLNLQLGNISINNEIVKAIEEAKIVDKNACEYEFINNIANDAFKTDIKRFSQILGNLLTNAAKYSPKGAKVKIEASENDKEYLFKVIDRGVGVPEKDRDKILEPFYRSHNVGAVSGAGLGLAIVKRAAESLGGSIHLTSKVGEGSTFYATIPKELKE